MRTYILTLLLTITSVFAFSQQTKVTGQITDSQTGEELPFVKVRFQLSKISAMSDLNGSYVLESYYASDSVVFSFIGYAPVTVKIKIDQTQEINVSLTPQVEEIEEVFVRPPDELYSTTIHKRIVANKRINNKEKLESYDYEVYNKMQLDLNNLGEKFKELGVVQKLDLIMDYLDSNENGKNYLPVLLSESISDFHYQNSPKRKREIIKASKISGIENFQINQLLGDMYLDINVYDNYINLFQRSFISPIANFARSYYNFVLTDSTFIGDKWCFHLTFEPKRTGDMTFSGDMWIHDTTYAVKEIKASLSPWANINYVQDLYFEQKFDEVEKEVWMQTEEKMIVDLKITKKTEIYGFYGRKFSSRRNFVINKPHPLDFYKSDNTVEYLDSAETRSKEYWAEHRYEKLSIQEEGINEMVDSLNNTRYFKTLKDLTYLASTGYYPLGKVELGSIFSLFSVNPVEKYRFGLALRTSNDFSRRIELGGKIAYGVGDDRFKYGAKVRWNITKKKRSLMTAYYNSDIEQVGISATASSVNSTFASLLRTGPLDKLTFIQKFGANLEKDVKKDFIFTGGFEWRELTALGLADYTRYRDGAIEQIDKLQTAEFSVGARWGKNEEFLSGAFDRTSIGSKFPILSVNAVFGVKGILGSQYDYQKVEFRIEHNRNVGVLGRLNYHITAGYIFGQTAYPFLKVHEGNQSYWFQNSSFNKLDYFEFISDKYVSGSIEQHWQGLLFDRIPLIKKLNWRLVTTIKAAYGEIDTKHNQEVIIPGFTKRFGNVPYVEVSAGIENIFKLFRVDLVWRATHLETGMNPFGVRVRWDIIF